MNTWIHLKLETIHVLNELDEYWTVIWRNVCACLYIAIYASTRITCDVAISGFDSERGVSVSEKSNFFSIEIIWAPTREFWWSAHRQRSRSVKPTTAPSLSNMSAHPAKWCLRCLQGCDHRHTGNDPPLWEAQARPRRSRRAVFIWKRIDFHRICLTIRC